MRSGESRNWIAVAGGGTGGHVYPALSVIDAMRADGSGGPAPRVVWIGSITGPERRIVESRGVRFEAITAGKLRRYFSVKNLTDVVRIVTGCAQSFRLFLRYRPAVLFAKGGYVSVPPALAAYVCGVPVVAHESDLDPGLATRINSRFAASILLAYEESRKYYPQKLQDRVVVTGVPIRSDLLRGDRERGRRRVGADSTTPILLVLGGSQGARRVNELIITHLDRLCRRWFVVHQTGRGWRRSPERPNYLSVDYLREEYADLLAAADCLVCRAGATTLWEAAVMGKPMVLVPLGLDSSRGDQIRNAAYFERRGAAKVCGSGENAEARLLADLDELAADAGERRRLGAAARNLVCADAAERISAILSCRVRKRSVKS